MTVTLSAAPASEWPRIPLRVLAFCSAVVVAAAVFVVVAVGVVLDVPWRSWDE